MLLSDDFGLFMLSTGTDNSLWRAVFSGNKQSVDLSNSYPPDSAHLAPPFVCPLSFGDPSSQINTMCHRAAMFRAERRMRK
jgi:hypothetical protein